VTAPVDYFSFRKAFETALGKLRLPDGCHQQEPSWEPTVAPYFWTVEVVFDFADGKHIRIWESYDKIAGLYMSRKVQWAYHYGDTASFDEAGGAVRGSPDDPLDLRIDTCGGVHLHYGKREPHYRQEDIDGLTISDVDALSFVRAVLTQRQTGKSLAEVLKFKIKEI
jgi:hypothetical protein